MSFSIRNPTKPSKIMEELRDVERKLLFEHRGADEKRRDELDKLLHAVHIAKAAATLKWLLEQ